MAAVSAAGVRAAGAQQPACSAPEPVCAARESVFAISAFDPLGSAVRIDADMLVTVRHVVADEVEITVLLEDGTRRKAQIVPTGFKGDLALLKVEGLPEGPVASIDAARDGEAVFTVGADASKRTIVAYDEGQVTALPAKGFSRARLHSTAYSQPGNSGGALVDADGRLVGIVASGGEGRFEAIPASAIAVLQAESGPAYADENAETGAASRICILKLEGVRSGQRRIADEDAQALETACRRSNNRQNLDLAAQALGQSGRLEDSIHLYEEALALDPNAVNTRLGLAISLHIAGRYEEEVIHLRHLMEAAGEDPQVLRLAIQAGIWGGDRALSEKAFAMLELTNPQMAKAARRFLDDPPPRPKPRQ
ncbi:MAG: trypsin-like peptidase domain-containing protein [Rhodobiaceae bacterium]|nr:trypsin-like peptidase domain-containing protein [Rhodobiaceae bacterium]MCC0049157.1 trypsin-like peptidase domain-containing protein [Rhodobiaceae bacterium]